MLPLLVIISGGGIVGLLVYALILGIFFALAWYLIGLVTVQPANKILRALFLVFLALAVIDLLLRLVGRPFIVW